MGVRLRVPDRGSDYLYGMGVVMKIDPSIAALKADNERLQAENAKLKKHAEVMHKVLSWLDSTGGKGLREHEVMKAALDPYRADFPKETDK